MLTTSTNAINVTLHPKLPYDLVRDFEPVALLARGLQVLVVHPAIAATSFKEFIALVRARPAQLNYASSGSGTSGHLAMEVLNYLYVITKLVSDGVKAKINSAG